jgi:protein-L-isoaspartate(D-aspartate) O-methyltransferase
VSSRRLPPAPAAVLALLLAAAAALAAPPAARAQVDAKALRTRMVAEQVAGRGIDDPRVLAAMAEVPRHLFVPDADLATAYADRPLAIGYGQTVSQPYVVALITSLADLDAGDRVLEIGTGSGYQTAILARLAQWVFSLERIAELAQRSIRRIRDLGLDNVKIQCFDGSVGWSEVAPFDRILVTAGAPRVPEPLLDQLKVGGRLLVPEGDRANQRLVLYHHEKAGTFVREDVEPASFVPLIGRYGWRPEEE